MTAPEPTPPTPVPPTDMELMMLADGELDAERRAEIEAFLALADGDEAAQAARGKLSGLREVSALVSSDGVWPERAGVDVVDGVFARLDAEAKTAELPPSETPTIRERAASRDRASTPAASAGPALSRPTLDGSAASRRSGSAAPPAARPANDNGRLIYGMALAAAAAAAALFFWGKSGPSESEIHAGLARPGTVATDVAPALDPSDDPRRAAPEPLPSVEALRADPVDDESRYGVEVASVDFGQRSGAIYYVPTDGAATAAVTTVVWLSDE